MQATGSGAERSEDGRSGRERRRAKRGACTSRKESHHVGSRHGLRARTHGTRTMRATAGVAGEHVTLGSGSLLRRKPGAVRQAG